MNTGAGKSLIHDQEPWKMPLRHYIEHLYFKHFRKESPDVVLSIGKQMCPKKEKKEYGISLALPIQTEASAIQGLFGVISPLFVSQRK
jgi:hypothetical protein